MPFWFDRPRLADGDLGGARVLTPVDGTSKEAAHRTEANAGGSGDLLIAEALRAKREQQAIARRELPQRGSEHPHAAVFVAQLRGLDDPLVIRAPWYPARAPPLPIAQCVRGDGEQPATDVLQAFAGTEMPKELQERFLHDVFRVLMVPQQSDCEAVHRSAVLPEQFLGSVRGIQGKVHRQPLV